MLQSIMLQSLLLTDEGYVIDFGTMPGQLVFHAVMVLVLIFVIGKLLIKPLQRNLEKRQQNIQNAIAGAEEDQKKAGELKAAYQQKLNEADKEREQILQEAHQAAKAREEAIVQQARDEAELIRQRAERDIEQEREKALDQVRQESVGLAAAMTEKLLGQYVDETVRDKMLEDAAQEMEEAQWPIS